MPRTQVTSTPRTSEEELAYILATLSDYLGVRISTGDVLSTWSGIRPLPSNPKAQARDTASVVRDHGACAWDARICLGTWAGPKHQNAPQHVSKRAHRMHGVQGHVPLLHALAGGSQGAPTRTTSSDERLLLRCCPAAVIFMDDDGLLNVTGGKWTTYRRMAEETVDAALASGRLPLNAKPCATHHLPLLGATTFKRTLVAEVWRGPCGGGGGTGNENDLQAR